MAATANPTRMVRQGRARIEWAAGQMPVLGLLQDRLSAQRPFQRLRIGACLHVTAETGCLVRALVAGGAQVALTAANPLTTQDEVAAALRADGCETYGVRGEDLDAYSRGVGAVLDFAPQITIDDGADLLALAHATRPELVAQMVGGTEETTTGLVRLRALDLSCPVIAVNEARTERLFNDHYGTGQSTLDGILRATNLLLAGKTLVVLGFGWTGRGIADRARGAGAQVIVCEVDPIAALEARMEGYEVMPALHAASRGDIFICVTGNRSVLSTEHFRQMKDGAMLANAGHFDVEIDLPALAALGDATEVLPLVTRYDLGAGSLHLLASGRVVNLAAGQGHPAAVMDMSFATQVLAVEYLAAGGVEPGVAPVPETIDREVARLKLAALGVEIDTLSDDQQRYLRGWTGQ